MMKGSVRIYIVGITAILLLTKSTSRAFVPTSFSVSKQPALIPSSKKHIQTTSSSLLLRRHMSKDEDMTPEEREIAVEKALKAMTAFSNKYIANTSTKYCSDLSIPAVVIKGLAEHKVTLGAPLCPCRYYSDKEKEAKDGFWNCPCVPMRERHECHCMLFLTEDNDFAGEETNLSYDQVVDLSGGAPGSM
uniref:ferredoxin:thioredoxin reductase n=1 Tax=Helicotheca tamesis TaxID=374047 RepID=A0A7S2HLL3_9STRA|mmetsp:Transcript_19209/g.26429  ORF Transcript_19209/g.26429 Transcript_19209/m.26429 type:complete len:190 (+) Transcript_19209:279-848(+)|eukprot:CAMPEP_0185725464 /NCGR_PEP_ID=MMETSP1171-20130828/1719_1 /TAXON_ID=374046 /ORGANISM="Helicotheca tamensis, Strain CCMP826" /LENGTH=189 /DNA_ID=CAMNT_0028393603 /DNA_START=255 /DNA_END=824 /DNA_ORIENTATION=-